MKTYDSGPVLAIDIKDFSIKEFEYAGKAVECGFDSGKICAVLKGKRLVHKGFYWVRKIEFSDNTIEQLKLKSLKKYKHTSSFPTIDKKCTKCTEIKNLKDFHKRKTNRCGHDSICKGCSLKKNQLYASVKKKVKTDSDRLKERQYYHNRVKKDIDYRLKRSVKLRCNSCIRYKTNKYMQHLGCTIIEYKQYLSSIFIDNMSFDNYGKWHIDHIVPLATASTSEEYYKLLHYSNTRPLWASDNLRRPKDGRDLY